MKVPLATTTFSIVFQLLFNCFSIALKGHGFSRAAKSSQYLGFSPEALTYRPAPLPESTHVWSALCTIPPYTPPARANPRWAQPGRPPDSLPAPKLPHPASCRAENLPPCAP